MKTFKGTIYSISAVVVVGLLTLGVACAPQQGPGTPSSGETGWVYDGVVLGEVIKGAGVSFTIDIQVNGVSIFDAPPAGTDPFVGNGTGTGTASPNLNLVTGGVNVSLPAAYDPRPQQLPPGLPAANLWVPLGVMEDAGGTTGSFVYLRVHSQSVSGMLHVASFIVRAADNTDVSNPGTMPLLNLGVAGTDRVDVIVYNLGMQTTPPAPPATYANVNVEAIIAGQTATAAVVYMRHYPTGYFYDLVGGIEFPDFPAAAVAPDPAGTGLPTRQVSAQNFVANMGGLATDEYNYQDLANAALNLVDFQMTVRQPAYGAAPNVFVDPGAAAITIPTGAFGNGAHEIAVAVSLLTS